MGQILHGSVKSTYAVRALIQRSKASNTALSRELGINVKTVAKWRKRDRAQDAPMGPKEAHSTVLLIEEATAITAPSPAHTSRIWTSAPAHIPPRLVRPHVWLKKECAWRYLPIPVPVSAGC